MEKHGCKLCHRNFANGRALGGHMRSHMMNLYASSNKPKKQEFFMEEIESVPSSSSSSSEEEEEEEEVESEEEEIGEDKGLFFSYGMMSTNHDSRDFKARGGGYGGGMADSDQFCAAEPAGSSVVLQDRESETESSKNSNIRRRSRRVRKSRISDAIQFSSSQYNNCIQDQKPKSEIPEFVLPVGMDAEPASSISDTTPEEDVAHCLMMLSRDKWHQKEDIEEEFFAEAEEEEEEEEEIETEKNKISPEFGVMKVNKSSRSRGKYRCETCNKVFRSYQALGGHRASHKRIKLQITNLSSTAAAEEGNISVSVSVPVPVAEKIHECPVCYRVFSSGQALGGHKRSHVMGAAATQYHQISTSSSTKTIIPAPQKPVSSFIDLNLPAPIDEEEVELSAVSDADFVNPFKH